MSRGPEVLTTDFWNNKAWTVTPDDYQIKSPRSFTKAANLGSFSHGKTNHGHDLLPDGSVLYVPDFSQRLEGSDDDDREFYLSMGAAVGNHIVAAIGKGALAEIKPFYDTGFLYHDEGDPVFLAQQIMIDYGGKPTLRDRELMRKITHRVNYDGDHTGQPAPQEALTNIEAIFKDAGLEFSWIRDKRRKAEIGSLIRIGDNQIFSNPAFVEELVVHLRNVNSQRRNGILVSALGLPEAIRRFAPKILGDLPGREDKIPDIDDMARADERKFKESTEAIGIVGSLDDSPQGRIRVGMAYQKAALEAETWGIKFGARAVLVETGELHQAVESLVGFKGRLEMMFRAGFAPSQTPLRHSLRFLAEERGVIRVEPGKRRVPFVDKPTIVRLDQSYGLADIKSDLGYEEGTLQVDNMRYPEYQLPNRYQIAHPEENPKGAGFVGRVTDFKAPQKRDEVGVWVLFPPNPTNPNARVLTHFVEPDQYHTIITHSNRGWISDKTNLELRDRRKAVILGQSGSGWEITRALAGIGLNRFVLADNDHWEALNFNRAEGDEGENKAYVNAWSLWKTNPFRQIEVFEQGVTKYNARKVLEGATMIFDQMDGSLKLFVHELGNELVTPVLMNTNFVQPRIVRQDPGDPPFEGQAAKTGITQEKIDQIDSAKEALMVVIALMGGPEVIPVEALQNFVDILEGRDFTFTQPILGAMDGGSEAAKHFIAHIEGGSERPPKAYTKTTPNWRIKDGKEELFLRLKTLYEQYFGPITPS